MKLLRFGPTGQEKPGMLDASGKLRSLEGVVPDIGGHTLTSDGMQSLKSVDPESLPLVEGTPRIGPCVLGGARFVSRGASCRNCGVSRIFKWHW